MPTGANWPQATGSNFDLGSLKLEHGQKPGKVKVGTCTAQAESGREELQILRPLQYCRKREITIATTAPALQTVRNCSHCERSSVAKRGNCNYHDRSSVAERQKLQLLQQLQYSIAEKETVIIATLPALQKERNWNYQTFPVLQR